jgi:hypothetical protein
VKPTDSIFADKHAHTTTTPQHQHNSTLHSHARELAHSNSPARAQRTAAHLEKPSQTCFWQVAVMAYSSLLILHSHSLPTHHRCMSAYSPPVYPYCPRTHGEWVPYSPTVVSELTVHRRSPYSPPVALISCSQSVARSPPRTHHR